MPDFTNIYIDGAWVPSDGSGSIEVVNAATEQVMGSIPDGAASDVDKAVAAASRAFDRGRRHRSRNARSTSSA